ncbi:MAG: sugar ABC transporter permease [Gemmatimonadota bacterium]
MKPSRWITWTGFIGVMVVAAAMTGLALTVRHAILRERRAADTGSAVAVAGYLSLVTPVGPGGSDYQLAALLSSANTIAANTAWTGHIQVAWRSAPLLRDSIDLTPLDPATSALLNDGYATAHVTRAGREISLAPLLDHDQWNSVGWVGVWNSLPVEPIPSGVRWIGIMTVIATLFAVHLAQPGHSSRRRWTSASLAVVAMLLLTLEAGQSVQSAARLSTDVILNRGRMLAQRAATIPQVNENDIDRVLAGARATRIAGQLPADSVRRVMKGDVPAAVSEVALRSGNTLQFSMLPREAELETFWAVMFGWVGLFGLGLGFTAWAGAAQGQRRTFRETMVAWGFIAPAMVHLVVFSLGPLLFAVYLSFHRWGLIEPVRPFVGLSNFREVLGDPRFWHSLGVTALYTLYVPLTMAVALAAALALDRSGVRIRLARGVLFLPFISSVVAVALVWQWMLQADFGLINAGLAAIGVTGPDWLGNPRTALLSVMLLSIWVQLGYQMMIFLAGLQGIPGVYHDAARVDGAGAWQRFRRITLPLLRPTILFVLVTGTISSFQVFTYVSVMTEGGPARATEVVVFRIYQEAWEFLRFGTASVMSLVLLATLLLATWLQFRWLGRKVELV